MYDKRDIVNYLEGRLDPDQKLAFEQAVQKDPDLLASVEQYRKATSKNGVSNDFGTQLKQDIGWPMWVLGGLIVVGIALVIYYFMGGLDHLNR